MSAVVRWRQCMLPPLCGLLLFVCEQIFLHTESWSETSEMLKAMKISLQPLSVLFVLYFFSHFSRFSHSWWTLLLLPSLVQPTCQPVYILQLQISSTYSDVQSRSQRTARESVLDGGKKTLFDQKLYADGHICDHKTSLRDTSSATESYFYFFVFL